MNSDRKTAIMVGVLYIIGTVAGILSAVATSSVLGGDSFLAQIRQNEYSLLLGVVFVLIMGFTLAMIPMKMFPLLRKTNEPLALWYVAMRGAVEVLAYVLIAVAWLALISVSRLDLTANSIADQISRVVMGTNRYIFQALLPIAFSLGALAFYYLLFKAKLVSRWLSLWGIIGIALHLIAALVMLFGFADSQSMIVNILNFPIFVQEMLMALILIIKGFRKTEPLETSEA